jgi:hypothetical protein
MTTFVCVRCSTPLTSDLSEVALTGLPEPAAPYQVEPGEDCPAWLPLGQFAVDPDPFGPPHVSSPTDDRFLISAGPRNTVLINPDDLLVHRLHPDPSRRNGCCGLDGTDGPNLVCNCGNEIGTESSDCWTARVVRLEPLAVARSPQLPM